MDFEIFRKYIERFNELKNIIVPVSYFSLWHKLGEGPEHWRLKNYSIYYGIKIKKWHPLYHFELLNGRLSEDFQRLHNYYFLKKDDVTCTPLGWIATDKVAEDMEKSGEKRALLHTYNIHSKKFTRIFNYKVKTLSALAEICNQNDIKLLFITLPTYHTYRKNLNAEQLSEMYETIYAIIQKYSDVQYINWHEDQDFIAEDFWDSDHLNESGAKKLSVKLASYIDSLGIINKHGN
jgi:hypothetical protein